MITRERDHRWVLAHEAAHGGEEGDRELDPVAVEAQVDGAAGGEAEGEHPEREARRVALGDMGRYGEIWGDIGRARRA